MQSLSIYILQGIKYLTLLQIHNVFAYIISYYPSARYSNVGDADTSVWRWLENKYAV